jgi:hypothetical protein
MNANFLESLAESPATKLFLSKSYGLELLFCLELCGENDADNGIDDTYEMVRFFKPRRAAFSQFCCILRDSGAVEYLGSTTKKSKRVLRLTEISAIQLNFARRIASKTYSNCGNAERSSTYTHKGPELT